MSTEEIKEVLDQKFPKMKFKRKAKVKDQAGYTVRAFESKTKNVVVISMEYDDFEIAEICEVQTIPSNQDLKSTQRIWKPGGPLSGYYFSMGDPAAFMSSGVPWFTVCEKSYWNDVGCIYDGEVEQALFNFFGFESLMESTYQCLDESLDTAAVRALLVSLGAIDRTGDPTFDFEM